ncbi:MAG: ATP-binding protein [Microbacteriaceae bacterium]
MRPRVTGRRLRRRLLALELGIVIAVVVIVSAVLVVVEERQITDETADRTLAVATQMADLPIVQDALSGASGRDGVQAFADTISTSADVTYVVIADMDGVRLSHPDEDRVGLPTSTDHSLIRQGETFVGIEEGTLGPTLRAKVPVELDGEIIGTVSVGVLQSDIRGELLESVIVIAPWILGATAIGSLLAAGVTRAIRRRIYGVEPDEVTALLQSQQALLSSVRDGVVAIDPDESIVLVNDEARRLLGVDDSATGRPMHEVLDDDLVELLREDAEDAAGDRYVLAGERVLLAARSDATVDGLPAGRTLTLRDRTEIERTLRELEGQRSLADALSSQSHEFANRIHVISGLVAMDEPEALRTYLADLGSEVARVASPISGAPRLSAMIGTLTAVARDAGVTIEVDPASDVDAAAADDDDLLTVVGNLVGNALDATGDGGRIRVLVSATGERSLVRVDDDGPGIPAALRDRVTHRGFSTKTGGADAPDPVHRGIGLALVSRIAERRSGTLLIAESPWGGARVETEWARETAAAVTR